VGLRFAAMKHSNSRTRSSRKPREGREKDRKSLHAFLRGLRAIFASFASGCPIPHPLPAWHVPQGACGAMDD